jgi:hypothetical protein
VPYGRSNLSSRLQFGYNQEGGPRSLYEHEVELEKKKTFMDPDGTISHFPYSSVSVTTTIEV